MRARLQLPVTLANASNGSSPDVTVNASIATLSLPSGLYKLAAVGTNVRWRLGASPTGSSGSFLAANDQELVHVPGFVGSATTMYFIRDTDATSDGRANVVPVVMFDVPGGDARDYDSPTS